MIKMHVRVIPVASGRNLVAPRWGKERGDADRVREALFRYWTDVEGNAVSTLCRHRPLGIEALSRARRAHLRRERAPCAQGAATNTIAPSSKPGDAKKVCSSPSRCAEDAPCARPSTDFLDPPTPSFEWELQGALAKRGRTRAHALVATWGRVSRTRIGVKTRPVSGITLEDAVYGDSALSFYLR